ncbi:MAG TPA: hypothetical protein VE344_00475 [Methylomirabilota bacterium]|nr:hypothetical protein [Methylomirabilota bacterium]
MKKIKILCVLTVASANGFFSLSAAETSPLPWLREMPLREAAQSVTFESTLNPTDPLPGPSMSINNLKMRTTIWGPPDRITISLTKNNVWDRRVNWYDTPTLEEITEGAFSPANKDYVGIQPTTLRPKNLGWLRKEGGEIDPYRKPVRYAFPCLKPVGQIVFGIDAMAGTPEPRATQSCADGVVSLEITNGNAKASLEYVLGMTNDIYAIRGNFDGIKAPVWLRLYRHKDTSHMMYMNAEGTRYTVPEAGAGKAFNGPIDAPTGGRDGNYFWIRQKFPAEKTFPKGFEYVLMGVVTTPGKVTLETAEGKTGLGTPPANLPILGDWLKTPRAAIADAPGAAATATFSPGSNGKLEALVTIVTTMDGSDLIAFAKQKLKMAEAAGGFDGVVRENTKWWNDFYDARENGRIFHGLTGTACSEDVRSLYQQSWTDSHGGGTKTDMRQLESSASYVLPEQDLQGWNSGPCYNEIFTTSRFVRNWADSEDMWKQLVEYWMPGAKEAARDMFHMPGMFISHGYLPPIKPDRYLHSSVTLELCLGTMAQTIRPAWDEWDYGGDTNFLRNECYPLMKQMALFYAAYAKKGADGYYHVTPSVQEESWGIYPQFSHTKDVISSLCMFRWGLTRAADAAEVLGVDAGLQKQWREVAAQIVPYPTWQRTNGLVFAEMPGLEPFRLANDHFGDAASYPTVLADEINLDSPQEQKDMMIRSVRTLPSGNTSQALMLLGVAPDQSSGRRRRNEDDAETLLNSRSGRIHLFPIAGMNEVAFHNFQARGGFLVSAGKNAAGIYHVEIQSRRDIPCELMNPWPGKPVNIHEVGKTESVLFRLDKANGECLVFATVANHKYQIEPE